MSRTIGFIFSILVSCCVEAQFTAVSVSSTDVTCYGDCDGSIILTPSDGTSPYSYIWNPTVSDSSEAYGLCAGDYSITVIDANDDTVIVNVTINEPQQVTVTAIQTVAPSSPGACDAEVSLIITGISGIYTVQWFACENDSLYSPPWIYPPPDYLCGGAGYGVQVTDEYGCQTTTCFVIYDTLPECDVACFYDNITCPTQCTANVTAQASGEPPYSFDWSNGEMSQTIDSLCAGTYTVTMTDSIGCVATQTVYIYENPEIISSVSLVSDPTINGACDGELDYSVSGGSSPYVINWYDCTNGNFVGTEPLPANSFCAGDYRIIVTDDEACKDTSDCVTLIDPPLGAYDLMIEIPVFTLIGNVMYFSVPVNKVIIHDIQGKRLYQNSEKNQNYLDLPVLPTGIYLMTITGDKGEILTEKFRL